MMPISNLGLGAEEKKVPFNWLKIPRHLVFQNNYQTEDCTGSKFANLLKKIIQNQYSFRISFL